MFLLCLFEIQMVWGALLINHTVTDADADNSVDGLLCLGYGEPNFFPENKMKHGLIWPHVSTDFQSRELCGVSAKNYCMASSSLNRVSGMDSYELQMIRDINSL